MSKVRYSVNKQFFNQDTPEAFYVAGFIAADGCVHQKRAFKVEDGAQYLTLTLQEKDKDHLEKIKNLLEWTGPLHRKINKRSFLNNKEIKESIQYYFQICSLELCQSLIRFGIGERKSLTYVMPKWLTQHPLVNYFLLGYFDGDGCISFTKKNMLLLSVVGTRPFLQQFNEILVKNNISNVIDKKMSKQGQVYSLHFNGLPKCSKIYEFLLGKNIISLNRKKDIYNTANEFMKNRILYARWRT